MNDAEFIKCLNCGFPAYRISGKRTYSCQKCKSNFINDNVDEVVAKNNEIPNRQKTDIADTYYVKTKNKNNDIYIYQAVAGIIVIGIVIAIGISHKSSNESVNVSDSMNYLRLNADSTVKAIEERQKTYIDSVSAVNNKLEKKRLGLFYKTPSGKAEIADKKREQAKIAKESARIQRVMNKFSCSEEDARSVLEGKIWIGMQISMVVYERGNPNVINPSNYGYGEHYQWCWEGYSPSCFYGGADGIVTAYN